MSATIGLRAAHSSLFHEFINGKLFAALEDARFHPPFDTMLEVHGGNGEAWRIELHMTELPEGRETVTDIVVAETPVIVSVAHPFSDEFVADELDKLITLAVQIHTTKKAFTNLYM